MKALLKAAAANVIKQIFLTLLFLGFFIPSFAQDIIYKKDGSVIHAKIQEVTETAVRYRRHNNPNGPTYTDLRNKLIKIVYESGGEDIYDQRAAAKLTAWEASKDSLGNAAPLDLSSSSFVYAELLGISGILSINYEGQLAKDGPVHLYGRLGLGFSNASLHVPHGFLLGFGSDASQLELGINGAFISRFRTNPQKADDAFSFLHGDGEFRYSISPSLGYRYQNPDGFFFKFYVPLIISKDNFGIGGRYDYIPTSISTNSWGLPYTDYKKVEKPGRWGVTPWIGFGLGYSF
ncbi:MAG: hypothetical protein H6581_10690 [Bacteroidia bacterium]|nr:hypothetical protein [Bacteroidia bacterium]